MNPVQNIRDLIAAKRDGEHHSEADLRWLAQAAADPAGHHVELYQLAAWLMAAYLHPLTEEETANLTLGMAASGERLDLSALPHPWIDKHSTGGIGDKTSIALLPILASAGLTVVKMSGRGLGLTGGTVDKLASIPGFRVDLSPEEMVEQASRIGIALTGQTPNLAPADKTLYALRDTTETVASIPLIVSSILSKKIAGGAEILGLDVKCGSGAFMQTLDEARQLAHWLLRIAKRCGLKAHATLTDMDQPLGRCAGNALEVSEGLQTLQPNRPLSRFGELVIYLAAETLHAVGRTPDIESGKKVALELVTRGAAQAKAKEWIAAQGGDARVIDDAGLLPRAPVVVEVQVGTGGWVERVDAATVGRTVLDLGGGRQVANDPIDPSVGVETLILVGDKVSPGQTAFRIHAASTLDAQDASEALLTGLTVSAAPVAPRPVVLETL